MAISTLEALYLDCCRRHKVLPNSVVLSWFSKAKYQRSCQEKSRIVVLLNQLQGIDILPLIDLFFEIDSSDFYAVDVYHESPCNFSEEHVMLLLRAINMKLRVVDLRDMLFGEDFLRDLCGNGLACHILKVRSTHIKKLNMDGRFMRLHTLNLDFCTSITSLHKDCFSCMPNLIRLSMCGTRVSNLWTTTAALSKLPSLLELRFQNCLCCEDTGPCSESEGKKANTECERLGSAQSNVTFQVSCVDKACGNFGSLKDSSIVGKVCSGTDKLSDDSEVEISSCLQKLSTFELKGGAELQDKIQGNNDNPIGMNICNIKNGSTTLNNNASHHPSPICFEKHYREYMVVSLPHLEVLDNLLIKKTDREMARTIFSEHFEHLPYKRQRKESVVGIMQTREIGANGVSPYGKSKCFFERSLAAVKLGSVAWPHLQSVSSFSHIYKDGSKRLRARQFEYHPSDPSLMAFGTLDGEVVVINHENRKLVGHVPSVGAMNSVLGLCWLKKYPSKLLAGSDNGCLKLFDSNLMPPRVAEISCSTGVTFDNFKQLTSVHVNSTDDKFLASGFSKDVALYDINTGKRLEMFTNMHQQSINVVKFAHHSPFIFATSSFDRNVKLWDLRQKPEQPCYTVSSSRGNVMACFSPDDRHLLVSAVDNEVKQLSTVDGRVHMNFEIASTGSTCNYTRSYYINGGDYIITGSCEEQVIRVCCAQTGRRLRDVYLEDCESRNHLFVQSLRGDPSRYFHMSILTSSRHPNTKWEIFKVNLLSSSLDSKECT